MLNLEKLNILDAYNTSRQESYKSDYGALKEGGWVHEKAIKQLKENKPDSIQSNADYAKEIYSKYLTRVKEISEDRDFYIRISFSVHGHVSGKIFSLRPVSSAASILASA